MSDLYRIKPLVWKDYPFYSESHKAAFPVRVTLKANGCWRPFYGATTKTRNEAKAAAEQWYRERLLTALEKVDE